MSKNCLVTQLKGSIDNNSLPVMGGLDLYVNLVNAAQPIYIGKPFYDTANQVTLSIVEGTGYLANTSSAATGDQSVNVKAADQNQVVYLHGTSGDTIRLRISNYYKLRVLKIYNNVDVVTSWPTVKFDASLMKYIDGTVIGCYLRTDVLLNIGQFKVQDLIYSGELYFADANVASTPDIGAFTAFDTVEDCINALIYFKDKYRNAYYNGPRFEVKDEAIPFVQLPAEKQADIYDALITPLTTYSSPNLRQIYLLGSTYTVSGGDLLENGVVVPEPN